MFGMVSPHHFIFSHAWSSLPDHFHKIELFVQCLRNFEGSWGNMAHMVVAVVSRKWQLIKRLLFIGI